MTTVHLDAEVQCILSKTKSRAKKSSKNVEDLLSTIFESEKNEDHLPPPAKRRRLLADEAGAEAQIVDISADEFVVIADIIIRLVGLVLTNWIHCEANNQ